MTCGGGQVIFIDKGSYGDVSLDGLAFAFMGQSPEGKSMMESIGNWNFAYLYIDEKANPAQRKALEEIARATSPPAAPPERTKIRYAPISRKVEGSEHIVSLGNYGSFSGQTAGWARATRRSFCPGVTVRRVASRTTKRLFNTRAGGSSNSNHVQQVQAASETTSQRLHDAGMEEANMEKKS
jgi:hypothetical protein